MSNIGFEAKPLSRANIREYAKEIRQALGFDAIPYIDIEKLLDFILPKAMPGFAYDIRPHEDMGNNHGLADPENRFIVLREDVHERACDGHGRDRLTVIHEFGHLLLHPKDRLVLRRGEGKPKSYCDPEWQANCFAGEFLVAFTLLNGCKSAAEAASMFGVSQDAAQYQLGQFRKEGLL